MTITRTPHLYGPKDPPALTVETFLKQVLHKNTGEDDPDGGYNADLKLGGYTGYKSIGDINHDNIPDGAYDFSTGYTVLALSRQAKADQETQTQDAQAEGTEPKERPDINGNRRPEDPPFAILTLDDGTSYDLVREDPPLKILQAPKLPKGEEEIVHPEHTNFTTPEDFRKSVLTEGGTLNAGWGLGTLKGAMFESDLTGDGIPERVFGFDSGKSVILVSNYGATEKRIKDGRSVLSYNQLYDQWNGMKDKSSWIARNCTPSYDYGDWDGEGRRPIRVRTYAPDCDSTYTEKFEGLRQALLDYYEEVPIKDWQDVDGDNRREHIAGSVALPQADGTLTTYAIMIEDAKMWTEGQ